MTDLFHQAYLVVQAGPHNSAWGSALCSLIARVRVRVRGLGLGLGNIGMLPTHEVVEITPNLPKQQVSSEMDRVTIPTSSWLYYRLCECH